VRRQLYRGWDRSVHEAYSFDSWHEAKVAFMLDNESSVHWWVRNEPKRLRIPTPLEAFYPDFVARFRLDGGETAILLLEVKGDTFWNGPESEPRLKASAARRWVAAQANVGDDHLLFGVALESVIEQVNTARALLPRLESPRPEITLTGD
jgi:restriction endonuclease